jgi:hypothetical protein
MLTCVMGTSLVPLNVEFSGDKKCKVAPLHVMKAYGGWDIQLLHSFLI